MPEQLTFRLSLPDVTLVAISSVNLDATVAALTKSMARIDFGAAKLLTDKRPAHLPTGCALVPIAPLASARAYSTFLFHGLADHVDTPHCLLVQWDGYVLRPEAWRTDFLDYDFVGASWPQFPDGHDVGNGGFSLRSRALMEACRDRAFRPSHPEDLAIGRANRPWLERCGLRFAPKVLADAFSTERAGNLTETFGFHGVWHMPQILGNEQFFEMYRALDERGNVRHDFSRILWQIARGRGGLHRAVEFMRDRARGFDNAKPGPRKAIQ